MRLCPLYLPTFELRPEAALGPNPGITDGSRQKGRTRNAGTPGCIRQIPKCLLEERRGLPVVGDPKGLGNSDMRHLDGRRRAGDGPFIDSGRAR